MPSRDHPDSRHQARQREIAYQHWCAEIMREARDRASLQTLCNRALNDRDVRSDPILIQQIRTFVAQREAEFTSMERARAAAAERKSADTRDADRHPSVSSGAPVPTQWDADQVVRVLERLHREFLAQVTRMDETTAASAFARIQALQQDYPQFVDLEILEACDKQMARLDKRRTWWRRHIRELHDRVVAAAARGQSAETARVLGRLSAIHAGRPRLLPDNEYQKIHRDVIQAGEALEHRQAAQALVQRENAVVKELKHLAAAVQTFHEAVRHIPHESDAFRKAEAEYERAVAEIRSHDDEWFAALILELVDLLEEWHAPQKKGQKQIDRFLKSVRNALMNLRKEIRGIEHERRKASDQAPDPDESA